MRGWIAYTMRGVDSAHTEAWTLHTMRGVGSAHSQARVVRAHLLVEHHPVFTPEGAPWEVDRRRVHEDGSVLVHQVDEFLARAPLH